MKKSISIFVTSICFCAFAQEHMLVSIQEMNNSNQAPPRLEAKSIPDRDAPILEIVTPKESSVVTSPTPVEIKFQAGPQSSIKPDTFKVLYGTFQLDITNRILSLAQVTAHGINVESAKLPPGKHKLTLKIEDTKGRAGFQVVVFEVR